MAGHVHRSRSGVIQCCCHLIGLHIGDDISNSIADTTLIIKFKRPLTTPDASKTCERSIYTNPVYCVKLRWSYAFSPLQLPCISKKWFSQKTYILTRKFSYVAFLINYDNLLKNYPIKCRFKIVALMVDRVSFFATLKPIKCRFLLKGEIYVFIWSYKRTPSTTQRACNLWHRPTLHHCNA